LAFAEVVGSASSRLEHLAIHMNSIGEPAGAAFAERMPLLLAGGADTAAAAGGVLKELFLNSNALGGSVLKRFAEQFRASVAARERSDRQQGEAEHLDSAVAEGPRPRGLALLNLSDNGMSQQEAEGLMREVGARCVETLIL
jgi:hypothetical protein